MSLPPRNQPVDWEALYLEREITSLPWYHEKLDPDLLKAISDLNIQPGSALDLGTGPGTQGFELAKLGFSVTASDLSQTAIDKAAKQLSHPSLRFVQDNILKSNLSGNFDLIFDRGCFHVLPAVKRKLYVKTVHRLLNPAGFFFLKCFSDKELREEGPHRFSAGEIEALFGPQFKIISIKESVYQGTLESWPQALFCIMKPL